MKRCPRCKTEKDRSCFWVDARTRSGLVSWCKECMSARAQELRATDPASVEAIRKARLRRKSNLRRIVTIIKGRPCTDCGVQFASEAMQFDHVRGVKAYNVAALVSQVVSVTRLLDEIEKCEVVCGNCHAVRTARRA